MKRLVTLLAVVAVTFVFTSQESQAQFYRGGSGFNLSIGTGGFNNGFGGFNNRGFGGSPYYGGGFNRGSSFGYSSFRPSYGRSYYQPSRSYYRGGKSFNRGGGFRY